MAATIDETFQRPVGELLRGWRERRRLSQLDLANQVEVSTRHVSFVETGRSKPSREMVLRLAEHLEVPLRDRNQLLLAGGYAPISGGASLHSPAMLAIREALRRCSRHTSRTRPWSSTAGGTSSRRTRGSSCSPMESRPSCS